MTILKYINELKLLLRSGQITDDEVLDNRLVLAWINNQRSLWLKNELNKGRSDEDNIRQTINGLELEIVNSSSFPDISCGFNILRTKKNIPRTVELLHRDNILSIRNSNMLSTKFNYTHIDKFQYTGNGKFNQSMIFATMYNNKIYLKSHKVNPTLNLMDYITITGIFEDPLEAIFLENNISQLTIDVLNKYEYPLSKGMWNYMQDAILQSNAKLFIRNEPDTNNNSANS